jgi:hypothetical protein
VDVHAQAPQQCHERVVLALTLLEVHGVEKAVRRIVECATEGLPGTLDEHVDQRRGHRPGAVRGEWDGQSELIGHRDQR